MALFFRRAFSTSSLRYHGGPAGGRGQVASPQQIPNVKQVITVASGKGGVGKSTTAINLAIALARKEKVVGVLDADVYGPSIPGLLGIEGRADVNDQKKIIPMTRHGLKAMSVGFLVDKEQAMIWRGPIVMSALEQLVREVDWGYLDILVVDLPPGTGDAHISLTQRVPLDGAVIVSTPQEIALMDARRGVTMFERVNVPILGFVENMSYFQCKCGERTHIFGDGGCRALAKELGVDLLGEVPLTNNIREMSDKGTPITITEPEGPESVVYDEIAQQVLEKLEKKRPAPSINIQ